MDRVDPASAALVIQDLQNDAIWQRAALEYATQSVAVVATCAEIATALGA